MSFVRRRAFSAKAPCSHSVLVPGRCLETIIIDNDIHTYFINIHFHGWSMHEVHIVAERLKLLHLACAANPLLYRIIISGDMSLRFSDKPVLDVSTSKAMFKEPKHPKVAKVLLGCLAKFTRIEHDQFTHFSNSLQHLNDIEHIFSKCSRVVPNSMAV